MTVVHKKQTPCSVCAGRGWLYSPDSEVQGDTACEACAGTGKAPTDRMAVVRLLEPAAPAPDPDVVATLEEWLEQARTGNLVGVALAGAVRGSAIAYRHVGAGHFQVLAALNIVESVVREWVKNDLPSGAQR